MIDNFNEIVELGSEQYNMAREKECIALAEKNGCEILHGDGHTLVFDLDGEEAKDIFLRRVEFLMAKNMATSIHITRSKSNNYHAVVELSDSFPSLSPEIRLAIQACIGSDWKKEMLGCLRMIHYENGESLLFRPEPLVTVYKWESKYGN